MNLHDNPYFTPEIRRKLKPCYDSAFRVYRTWRYVASLPNRDCGGRNLSEVVREGGCCYEKSHLLFALLTAQGFDCYVAESLDHAFVLVRVNGVLVPLDPTCRRVDCIFERFYDGRYEIAKLYNETVVMVC